MILQCDDISEKQEEILSKQIAEKGYKVTAVKTKDAKYLILVGNPLVDIRELGVLQGVKDVHWVSENYQLVSRKWKVKRTTIDLGDGIRIGDGNLSFMLGPCSIEDQNQVEKVSKFLLSQGIRIMRGGAFKPRTSPYSFRGLGIEGLKMMYEVVNPLGIKIIAEVLESAQIDSMYPYIDIYQVGTRNNQNFNLLYDLGKIDKPVLIKRGMSGTLEELLQSAEYVFSSGNEKILLCERGIRTFEKSYRNTLDINAIPVLKEKSHLPVIVDPSHGVGIRRYVEPIALAGIIAGADGLLVETHECPEKAASDGDQTLNFEEAQILIEKSRKLDNIFTVDKFN